MTRVHQPALRVAAPLADFPARRSAEVLAARLILADVPAEVWTAAEVRGLMPAAEPPLGPTVVVQRGDHAHALVLARLFDEIDGGHCAVAPPPCDLWHRGAGSRLAAASTLAVVAFLMAALFLVAWLI